MISSQFISFSCSSVFRGCSYELHVAKTSDDSESYTYSICITICKFKLHTIINSVASTIYMYINIFYWHYSL